MPRTKANIGKFAAEKSRLRLEMFQNFLPSITKNPLKFVGISANSSSLVMLFGVKKLKNLRSKFSAAIDPQRAHRLRLLKIRQLGIGTTCV